MGIIEKIAINLTLEKICEEILYLEESDNEEAVRALIRIKAYLEGASGISGPEINLKYQDGFKGGIRLSSPAGVL